MPLSGLFSATARLVESIPGADAVKHVLSGTAERRRVWRAPGHAHVQVRGISRPGSEPAAHDVETRLGGLDGVSRAEVNAALGRVAVAFDESLISVERIVEIVEGVELEHGLDEEPLPAVDHPGDDEPLIKEALFLGANLAGLGVSLVGRAVRATPLPAAVPALVSLVEGTPRVRAEFERRLGRRTTDITFAVAGALTQTLAQRPVGLAIDAAHRLSLLTEAQARKRAWQRRSSALGAGEGAHRVAPIRTEPRVAPLPRGPVERLAELAGPTALAAYGATFATTRNHQRAQALLTAGTPAAAHLGRDAFAAQLGRSLANAGVVALDPRALRRLDRLDTVVIDASVLLPGGRTVSEVVALTDAWDTGELYLRIHDLVDLDRPTARQERDGWVLTSLRGQSPRLPPQAREVARAHNAHGATVLALYREGEPVALAVIVPDLDPLAEELVGAARQAGQVVLSGASRGLARRLSVEQVVPGGERLAAAVRTLQQEGHGVAVVSARANPALRAADVGVGVVGRTGRRPPWEAHLVCGPGLAEAHRVISAIPIARQVSRRATQVALVGASAGAVLAVAGPAVGATNRALLAVGTAEVINLAAGTWAGVQLSRAPAALPADRTPWHVLSPQTVLDRLSTSPAGLDEEQARQRLSAAPHEEADEQVNLAQATLDELANPLTPALAAGAGISAAVGSLLDALLIGSVLLVNAVIGGVQRMGADRALRRLVEVSAAPVRLRRGGADVEASSDQLVPGDIIAVAAGDAVPADCRILHADGLEVDESSLTGESQLVTKTANPTSAAAVAERSSMLYEGTVVAAGGGIAVVVATGEQTEIGRTSRLASQAKRPDGVEARLRTLTKVTLPISLGAGAALMGTGLLRGQPLSTTLGSAVSLAVAAVPEGLPFVATVAELAAARRLSARGALVRNPPTIEALGRVDVLCFDKTGTLTEGRIRLRRVSDGLAARPLSELTPQLREVVAAAVRASPQPTNGRKLPHPTDRAVVKGGAKLGITEESGEWKRVEELPFEPGRGYHAVLGRYPDGQRVTVKGAPEVVLDRCTSWWRDDRPFDQVRDQIDAEVERLAQRGYRVLAVAERAASDRSDLTESRIQNLRFLGLLGLADPVRGTAAEAVARLRAAGVGIVMITGDHPSTAEAIAAELDVLDGRRIVTGPELDAMDDAALAARLPDIAVFARVSPGQKARIVGQLRAAGRVVAVTGDGANDAPAIRLADVGIALGERATPAAREAADLVVVDDRIETITDAIVEGRTMWASVRDAIAVLLGGNLGETIFALGSGLVGGASGLNARQLLLVNLLTDMLPAMALAVRPPPGVSREVLLAEGPERSLGTALTRDIYVRAAATAGAATVAWLLARLTGTAARASTVGLVALVAAQLGQTLALGGRSPLVLASGVVSLAALAAVVQVPGLSHLFGCRPLGPVGWAIAGAAAGGATLIVAVPAILRRATTPVAAPVHGEEEPEDSSEEESAVPAGS